MVSYQNGFWNSSESLAIDCLSTFGVTRGYEMLFSGINHNPRDILITLEMFTKRFCILQTERLTQNM
jgi:hypothetical protein